MITYRHKLIIILSLLVAVSQLITGFIISKQSEQALDENSIIWLKFLPVISQA